MMPLPGGELSSLTIKCGTFRIIGDGDIKGNSPSGPAGTVTIEAVNNIELNGTTSLGDVRLTGLDGGSLTLKTTVGSITGNGRINLGAGGIIARAARDGDRGIRHPAERHARSARHQGRAAPHDAGTGPHT
jgi:hypothetical protein